ncbi:MAG TPA: nucleotidyltransferase family protein [Xanthobacteraceae bacterium]|nr:nucleotidyltransferase family protein [Xanthobacteraceae bacterium]
MSEPAMLPPIAILAGGLAKRLRPASLTIPKSLIPVAGRPFIDHQMELLQRQGARKVVICRGYLGEQIEDHVRDGARYGLAVTYCQDGDPLLGTGGAIKKALPQLGDVFMVLYGDSYLPIAFGPVADAFRASGADGLMTVFRNDGRWDTSNVEFGGGAIRRYDKVNRTAAMQHIDYGLSVLRAGAFNRWPAGEPFDLAVVLQDLLAAGRLVGFEVHERFYEVGSAAGIAETERFILGQQRQAAPP